MKKIKDMPNALRPRERLIKYGPNKLSNSELLAILLSTGTKKHNVISLSKVILKKFKNNLTEVSVIELSKISGLGPAKASKIVASLELGKRLLKNKKHKLILKPQDVFNEMRDIRGSKKEHFVIFYLDTRHQEIKREIISIGTLNASLVHPREVFEPAIKNTASHIVLAHNHPSGVIQPSKEDIKITESLKKAGEILDIKVIDHIIVSQNEWYSMNQNLDI